MTDQEKTTAYVHGFNAQEQNRLLRQAEFLEQIIYRDVDFSRTEKILEVGCGVGGQSAILLRRFPNLKITGIDMNPAQLDTCQKYLASLGYTTDRFESLQMDAQKMSFKEKTFDGAFLCWILEHVPDPAKVLSEVRRVLKPGGKVFITEVINSSFFVNPYSPNVMTYWARFNDFQWDGAGDPFVGAKLGNLLSAAGFQHIETNVKTMHLDNRQRPRRQEMIQYWRDLMLSASEQLVKAKYIPAEMVKAVSQELRVVEENPDAVFMYSFMQASAVVG